MVVFDLIEWFGEFCVSGIVFCVKCFFGNDMFVNGMY